MHAGGIAALIAAGAFLLLVLLLAYPLIKLGRALDQATSAIRSTQEGTVPLLAKAQETLENVTLRLNEVEEITGDVRSITGSVAALTVAVTSTVSGPLVKLAALYYGVRTSVLRRHVGTSGSQARRSRRVEARSVPDRTR